MRILTWTYSFWPGRGGLERLATQLVSSLAARGHEQLIVTQSLREATAQHVPLTLDHDAEHYATFAGAPIHRIEAATLIEQRDVRGISRLTAEMRAVRREFDADVVHMLLLNTDALIAMASDEGAPLMVANHLSMPREVTTGSSAFERLLRRAERIVVVSESVRAETVAVAPDVAGKIRTILNGVPVTADPVPIPFDPPTVLSYGRVVAEKGFATLLVAISLVATRIPDVRLVIAGDGFARQGLEFLAHHLGIAQRVTFTGWVDAAEVQRLIDASSVVVVPSTWNEPFGLTAAEAGERARPVIASRIGGLSEVVVDGETGRLVQAGDPLSLAAALEMVLSDHDLARAYGAAGRALVHERFDFQRCLDDYETALMELAR